MIYLIKYVPSKAKDLNLCVFNMITGINKPKRLAKHITCECKCKFDDRKYNSNQKWNNNKCRYECKNGKEHHVCKKDFIWNPAACSCKNGKNLSGIINDSVVKCGQIIEETKTIPKYFNDKNITCKTKNRYSLLTVLLTIIDSY